MVKVEVNTTKGRGRPILTKEVVVCKDLDFFEYITKHNALNRAQWQNGFMQPTPIN